MSYSTINLVKARENRLADRVARICKITIEGLVCAQIPLTRGLCAIVDDADVPLVAKHCWCAIRISTGMWYAHANVGLSKGKMQFIEMHTLLAGEHTDLDVDHRNGNGLDNRRCNFRICTHQENSRNAKRHRDGSSKFKGVSWYAARERWRAYIVIDAKQIHLGYFDNEVDAAIVYDAEAKRRFGEFARLNFQPQQPRHWLIPMIGF